MKKLLRFVFFLFLVGIATTGFAQTVEELKFTIKKLEAENNKLKDDAKKASKKSNKKGCVELEKEVQRLEEDLIELQRENVRIRGAGKEDDVKTKTEILEINDSFLKTYLLRYCDMDNDGVLTQWDADHTYIIDFDNDATSLFKVKSNIVVDLDGLKYFKNLKKLVCSGNNIIRLNLTNNVNLESLIANNCGLKILDVSKNTKLKYLECNRNALYVLDVANNPNLSVIDASGNQLDELALSNCKELQSLLCANNSLASLDVASNIKLKVVDCSNNKLTQLSFVTNVLLDSIYCQNNSLVDLDIRNNKDISFLDCSRNNNLTTVYISDHHKVLSDKKGKKTIYR